jgi:hypothetical protein
LNALKKVLAKHGLPEIRFHDLRHTCATLLLSKNVNPKIVSEMLGHGRSLHPVRLQPRPEGHAGRGREGHGRHLGWVNRTRISTRAIINRRASNKSEASPSYLPPYG